MIKKIGYDGILFALYNNRTGEPAKEGEQVVDFRGDPGTIVSGRPPHKPSSQGHVSAKRPGVDFAGESYASVYGLEWVKVTE